MVSYAGFPFFGWVMDEDITPLESGFGHLLQLHKETFIGREALIKRQEPAVVLVGLKILGYGIMRRGL